MTKIEVLILRYMDGTTDVYNTLNPSDDGSLDLEDLEIEIGETIPKTLYNHFPMEGEVIKIYENTNNTREFSVIIRDQLGEHIYYLPTNYVKFYMKIYEGENNE